MGNETLKKRGNKKWWLLRWSAHSIAKGVSKCFLTCKYLKRSTRILPTWIPCLNVNLKNTLNQARAVQYSFSSNMSFSASLHKTCYGTFSPKGAPNDGFSKKWAWRPPQWLCMGSGPAPLWVVTQAWQNLKCSEAHGKISAFDAWYCRTIAIIYLLRTVLCSTVRLGWFVCFIYSCPKMCVSVSVRMSQGNRDTLANVPVQATQDHERAQKTKSATISRKPVSVSFGWSSNKTSLPSNKI